MPDYATDRSFSNYVHLNMALPIIYKSINWTEVFIDKASAEHLDINHGIDYLFQQNGILKTVQERFRESKYQNYSDFTIRYRRDENQNSDRVESEYFKMKADFFVYGITNCLKEKITECNDFKKYAVVNIKTVYDKIDLGEIVIIDNSRPNCRMVNNKMECPIKFNKDGSSSFFPIDISLLINNWGQETILAQKGFV